MNEEASPLEGDRQEAAPESGGWHRMSRTVPAAWVGAVVEGLLFRCAGTKKVILREAGIERAPDSGGKKEKVVVLLPGEGPVVA